MSNSSVIVSVRPPIADRLPWVESYFRCWPNAFGQSTLTSDAPFQPALPLDQPLFTKPSARPARPLPDISLTRACIALLVRALWGSAAMEDRVAR